MGSFLLLPWFKLTAIDVPLAYLAGGVLLLCALFALNPRYRQQAVSSALFFGTASLIALWKGFDPIPIQPFGILVATGVVLGTKLAEWYAKDNDIRPEILSDFATHVVFIGFIISIILDAIFYHPERVGEFLSAPSWETMKPLMGLSSYGGFIGAIVGIGVWRWRRGMPAWPLADAVAFAFPLGWIFGRTGCFVVHDHPGIESHWALAVDNYNEMGVPRHDLGLYEVFLAAAVLGLFFFIRSRIPQEKRPMGLWVALLPIIYTPVRFGLDFLRTADETYYGLTPGHYASIGLFITGLMLLRYVRANPKWVIPDGMRFSKSPSAQAEATDSKSDDADSKTAKSSGGKKKAKKLKK